MPSHVRAPAPHTRQLRARGRRVAALAVLGLLLPALACIAARPARADDAGAATKEAEAAAAKAAAALLERMKSSDLDVKRPAVAQAKSEQHPTVTAQLARALSDADDLVRQTAIEGLAARTTPAGRKAAATAIAARLPRLTESPVLRDELLRALAILHDLAEPVSLKALAAHLGLDVEPEELAARLKAIANLPISEAVDTIIDFRATGGNRGGRSELGYRRRFAREAFAYATGTDVGNDPDAMRAWWKEHAKGFDFQAAAAERAKNGGGPKAKPNDGAAAGPDGKPGGREPKDGAK